MTHLGLFEGIGGFSLAARWAGWETVAWCEINPFCQRVLKYHFPDAEALTDIKTTDFKKYANRIDILTGGFPCQPYSTAGKRKGKEDDRHLWPEMLRAIREISPRWVVGENVRGLTNWNGGLVFDEVQADLEAEGYQVLPFLLPACAKGAPHRRDRIWFIAYSAMLRRESGLPERQGVQRGKQTLRKTWPSNYKEVDSDLNSSGLQERIQSERGGNITENGPREGREYSRVFAKDLWRKFPVESPIWSGNDGLPYRLDGVTLEAWRTESIKSYGNAVVPQVPFEIFKAINEYENLKP